MSDRIFASVRTESRLAPSESSPVLVAQPATLHTRTTHASTNDAACISILDAPLRPGETARVGFLRKEAELRDVFARLPVAMRAARAPRESIVLVSMIADLASECAVVAPDELAGLANVIAPGKTGAF